MYQQERKEKFIAQYDVKETRDTITSLFRSIESCEEKFGKDVSEMSVEELQETVDHALAVKTISKYHKLRFLDKYIRWCSVNKYPNVTDSINSISTAGLDKMRQQYVASPMHMQHCLDKVFDVVDDNTMDIVYRCYLWLGYMEFPEDRIAELTKEHLDFESHKLVFDARSYILYREAEPCFRKAAELTEFTYRHTSPSYETQRNRYPGNGLLRGIKGNFEPLTIRPKVNAKVAAALKQYEETDRKIVRLSYKRLTSAGMFYRTYERERAGMDVNPLQEFYEVFADRGIKSKSAMTMAHAYVNDYDRWKLAFSI